jgi:hypothetical protein
MVQSKGDIMRKTIAASAAALAFSVTGASASTIVDLGFILDESGSVGQSNYESSVTSLRNAIATIPLADANVTYRVGVISFGNGADVVATPIAFTSAADRQSVLDALLDESSTSDGGTRGYGTPGGITNATNYKSAFDLLDSAFATAFGTLGTRSIINMTTDGGNNSGASDAEVKLIADELRTVSGWDMLSFEAVANTSASDESYLASIGFDSSGQGGCTITDDVDTLTDVINNCFVIDVASFADYESAILKKVSRTVIDTGGDPNTGVVPLPAGLPLVLTALGAFGVVARRRRKA